MKWKYTKDKIGIIFDKDSDFYIKSQIKEMEAYERNDENSIGRILDILRLCLEVGPLKNVIDIGPMSGVAESIAKKNGAEFYVGLDISPRSIEYGVSKGRNLKLGDAHELQKFVSDNYNFQFDTCISIHMLEHCHSPQKVLSEVWKILKPGGRFGLRVPIQKDLTVQKNMKNGLPPHFCVFTPEILTDWLKEAGFQIKYKSISKEIIMIGIKET